jgi:hypothetical protein
MIHRYSTLLLLFASFSLYSQTPERDFNSYYRFPLSVGVEFESYSPFGEYGSNFNIFEISGNVRLPIPPLPFLQPLLTGGMIRFDNQDPNNGLRYDHSHWYGGVGFAASHRFAKNFEIGGDITFSLTQSYFPKLLPEEGTIGEKNILFEGGLHFALNPSYNFSIDIHPNVKYLHSLGLLENYNGFIFSIGFGASYRFGRDPDSPQAVFKSIQFSKHNVPDLFAAMQSYYIHNPIGTITITNTDRQSINDVNLTFYQNGFMDTPTLCETIPELKAGESREVSLYAVFNGEVFSTEGITPLNRSDKM